jgi:putative membrane protein
MAKLTSLTPADLGTIEAAVREAEARTTGEIYCVVAEESSEYGETPLAWAAGVALLAPALLLLGGIHITVPELGWSAAQAGQIAEAAARRALMGAVLLQGVLFVVTMVLVSLHPVRRALTPRAFKRDRVRRRAQEQFLAKNLHLTRERTGVLIFVSLAERMAEIIADEGISAHVDPAAWTRAMDALLEGLKRDQPAAGFAAAIGLCADLLAEKFPVKPGDNPNELPDAAVVLPVT